MRDRAVLRWLGPHDASVKLTNVIPVECACGVEDVLTALSELMARHDVLHPTFEVRGGEEIHTRHRVVGHISERIRVREFPTGFDVTESLAVN